MVQRIVRENAVYGRRSVESDEMIKLNAQLYRRNWVQIVGYSNGLVCMSPADNALFLYNPTTGDSKRLPELAEEDHETHGFGFDDLTNDYKVVKLVADSRHVLNASVYSLKVNSWRRICDLNYKRDPGFVAGMNVNGAIHWVFTLQEANKRVVFEKCHCPVKLMMFLIVIETLSLGNSMGVSVWSIVASRSMMISGL
ncbi:hypothetical protein F2Q70_00016548 [Brassica cretica]|uniref:F-box associated beta-propeller type 3 domain-containing protein n=1 Tax=Brassica cretica TaxID=69181 RepID=A0A8S9I5L4_BRACR|nr:hypothetical protein F2Q70_00016548 [Brassica cretica]